MTKTRSNTDSSVGSLQHTVLRSICGHAHTWRDNDPSHRILLLNTKPRTQTLQGLRLLVPRTVNRSTWTANRKYHERERNQTSLDVIAATRSAKGTARSPGQLRRTPLLSTPSQPVTPPFAVNPKTCGEASHVISDIYSILDSHINPYGPLLRPRNLL